MSETERKKERRYGHMMHREDAEELAGQSIHPDVFDMRPTGNLVFVVLEVVPSKAGMLHIPDTVGKAPSGVGYIIAVGPYAGHLMYAQHGGVAAVGPICDNPKDLIGVHAIFSRTAGVPLQLTLLEEQFTGHVLMMPSRDIQSVDLNRRSLVARVAEEYERQSEAKSLLVSAP